MLDVGILTLNQFATIQRIASYSKKEKQLTSNCEDEGLFQSVLEKARGG